MAASLTSTGITFGDGTTLTTKFGIIPQNSVTIFYQASAPPRWTKSTTHNDKTLRVVSGTGGGSGGSLSFTSAFPTSLKNVSETNAISGSVGGHTLDTNQIASHAHDNGGSVELVFLAEAVYEPELASDGYGNLYETGNQIFVGWSNGDVSYAAGWSRSSPGVAGNGGGEAHSHPWSGSAVFSQNIDLRVQYIDIISCNFDG
jgi:hypothetical protein